MPKEANRVAETATTTGTGTFTCGGAILGHQTFATAYGTGGNTDVSYTIQHDTTGAWEVGLGTYLGATNQLQRDTVLASSTGGSKISFVAGSKTVFVERPAEPTMVCRARRATDVAVELRPAAGQSADLLQSYNTSGTKTVGLTHGGALTISGKFTTTGGLASSGGHVELGNGNSVQWPGASGAGSLTAGIQVNNGIVLLGNTGFSGPQRLIGNWAADGEIRTFGWVGSTSGFAIGAATLAIGSAVSETATATQISSLYAGSTTFRVLRNGNVQNANNSYGAISDERMKRDISAAPSMTDLLMQVAVKQYRLNSDPDGPMQIGVIAQQAGEILPDLVDVDEDAFLSFAYSKLTPRLLKMAQELAARLDAVEAALP